MMRLDKFLADSGSFTRSEAGRAIRSGRVTVDGLKTTDPSLKIDETRASISCDGTEMSYVRFRYFMLNKPDGYVSTTEDDPKSILKLFPPEYSRMDLFPCGRLDIDTVGLLLVTNDGQTAHKLLSPKHHCEKKYRFRCLPLDLKMKEQLEGGITFADFTSKPCVVELDDKTSGVITVTEGKYHQIKRMFHAVGSEITFLERIYFAGVTLDPHLPRGKWREMTAEEIAVLMKSATAGQG